MSNRLMHWFNWFCKFRFHWFNNFRFSGKWCSFCCYIPNSSTVKRDLGTGATTSSGFSSNFSTTSSSNG
uniref:Uncharacterized protein n=1 Tax=Solanum lycopersicum TaxID=4081 RepID=A0A3Q7IF68_SOLLC